MWQQVSKMRFDMVLKRGWKMPCGRVGSVCSRPAPGAGSGSDAALGMVCLYLWNDLVTKLCISEDPV